MKRFVFFVFFVVLLFDFGWSQSRESAGDYGLLVQFDEGFNVGRFVRNFRAQNQDGWGLKIKRAVVTRMNIYLLGFDEGAIGEVELLNKLQNEEGVKYAQLNHPLQPRDTLPNDPLFGDQWELELIQAPAVWDFSTGGQLATGEEIVVAVLDKGFDIHHEDLRDNIWKNPGEIPGDGIDNDNNGLIDDVNGWNFRNNSPVHLVDKHGTSVAGIIGANGNNDTGIAGINWSVKMMFFTVNTPSEIVAAYNYVLEQRKRYKDTNGEKGALVVVTNTSLGQNKVFCGQQPVWGGMYDLLGEAGILSVAATANGSWDVDEVGDMPTSCASDFLIAVTNTDAEEKKVKDAAFGAVSIDLGAPGNLTSTTTGISQYRNDFSGTSSASPHVAGAVALLYSMPCLDLATMALEKPAETALLIKDAIIKGVEPIAELAPITVSGGRLDIYKSMVWVHAICIAREEERTVGVFGETYVEKKNIIRIYPNPSSDLLLIDFSTQEFSPVSIAIFNLLGQKIFEKIMAPIPFESQTIEISVSDWAVGTYFISLQGVDEKITKRFIKGPR